MTRPSKSLLQKYGFADPDKADPRHDLACRYLSQPHVRETIVALVAPPKNVSARASELSLWTEREGEIVSDTKLADYVRFNVTMHYETNTSQIVVGWVDLIIGYVVSRRFAGHERPGALVRAAGIAVEDEGGDGWRTKIEDWGDQSILLPIEVKISKIELGQIIRQIKFYRAYRNEHEQWLLATAWRMSQEETSQLSGERIAHFYLGSDWHRWSSQQPVPAASF